MMRFGFCWSRLGRGYGRGPESAGRVALARGVQSWPGAFGRVRPSPVIASAFPNRRRVVWRASGSFCGAAGRGRAGLVGLSDGPAGPWRSPVAVGPVVQRVPWGSRAVACLRHITGRGVEARVS